MKGPLDDAWEEGHYPVAYRYASPMVDWYERIPAWRQSLVDEVLEGSDATRVRPLGA